MKRFILSFLTIFGLIALSCGQPATQDQSGDVITPLEPAEFQEQWMEMKEQARLIDVRTKQEYISGHIPKAEMIDFLKNDFKQKISQVDKGQSVFVYCRSGNRSDRAAKQMAEMGFERIVTLTGGILAWEQEGFKLE